jgi:hypothetical protein
MSVDGTFDSRSQSAKEGPLSHVIAQVEVECTSPRKTTSSLRPLAQLLDRIESKRRAEVIRFRTCCADARASK